MKRVSNYHSHVALCGHAEGTVEDYVLEAIKHNYEEIGISDHAPIPVYFVGKEINPLYGLTPLIVFLYLIPCFLVFKAGMKRYASTGS